MPELPEVETTRIGLTPHVIKKKITKVIVRQPNLRWLVPSDLENSLIGSSFEQLTRRGKYLFFHTARGRMMVHLGMSGSLRIVPVESDPRTHDHIDIYLDDAVILRYHDPRRFGSFFWLESDEGHKLLSNLGPEPLSSDFDGQYLFEISKKRKVTIKSLVMNSTVVVGVGNIYANESLFLSGINPNTKASRVSKKRYDSLANQIKNVLRASIRSGGTTLRDFVREDGNPGYFKRRLFVYGRSGYPCKVCESPIKQKRINNRSTFFCRTCQS